jgi:imidazole glycerol-phosphate synthase subunit HisF
MLKPRLIPVLLFRNGVLVRSQNFDFFQSTGDPIVQVERLAEWKADEIIYLDISRDDIYNSGGTMQNIGSTTSGKDTGAATSHNFIEVIQAVAKKCFIPLTVGGKIRTINDIRSRLKSGADKVSINTIALESPVFITEAAKVFGSQCIVVSIDVRKTSAGWEVYSHYGERATGRQVIEWAVEVARRGAGEILLGSIDRDGVGEGYDTELVSAVAGAVSVPIITLGGVGKFQHFVEGLQSGASAIAAANIFHFTEQSVINAKRFLQNSGVAVRL